MGFILTNWVNLNQMQLCVKYKLTDKFSNLIFRMLSTTESLKIRGSFFFGKLLRKKTIVLNNDIHFMKLTGLINPTHILEYMYVSVLFLAGLTTKFSI